MPEMPLTPTAPAESRRELANRLFREFYSACFWHYRPDLTITDEMIPLVVEGLRRHGGRKGLLAAARLAAQEAPSGAPR
jgi:hypothetical protein